MKYYAGIGSRSTPDWVCEIMTLSALMLEQRGWVLRSGGAKGADEAFEKGVLDEANKEIYLPWKGFNKNPSQLYTSTKEAWATAALFHPAWEKLSDVAKKFMARNSHQIFGQDMNTPVDMVICWTPSGQVTGGTGQALRIANQQKIPIINLGTNEGVVKLLSILFPG